MSYLVFARKWRPLVFEDVVGQEHITDTLKKAIEKNRVAHAYIFTGTRGVGKTTTARILARALNCENGPTPTPCGTCTSCKDIVSGASFDVLEIDGASNNSVNDIRELRENVGYGSMSGKYRIFVIDEVHMLSNSAFNALLKTLEEPPKNVIFIFATTEPQKIPATIHSRCQRYDFRRISADHILERLAHICDEEKISYERSALMLVARKADGSMRDGLSLLDQVYSFCQEGLTEKEVRSVLGLVGMEVYEKVMDAIADTAPPVVLGLVQDVLYQGFDLHEFIVGLQEHLRNLLFARIPDALTTRGVDLEEDIAARYTESAQRFAEGDLLRMAEIVRKTENELKWSAYPRFLVETMLLKLVHLDSTVSIEKMVSLLGSEPPPKAEATSGSSDIIQGDVKKKLNPAPEKVSTDQIPHDTQPVVEDATQPAPVSPEDSDADEGMLSTSVAQQSNATFTDSEETSQDVPDIRKLWPAFLETLLRDRPKLGSFLSLATVASCTAHTIDIRFSPKFNFQFQELNKKHNRDEIVRILHTFTSRLFDLRMTVEAGGGHEDEASYLKQLGTMPVTINDEMENEPIIKTVFDIFDGEVIE
jgi:DNA polymerase III subunit gamma/tau